MLAVNIMNELISCWPECLDPQHPVEEFYFRYCPASCSASVAAPSESLCASWARAVCQVGSSPSWQGEQQQKNVSRVEVKMFCS